MRRRSLCELYEVRARQQPPTPPPPPPPSGVVTTVTTTYPDGRVEVARSISEAAARSLAPAAVCVFHPRNVCADFGAHPSEWCAFCVRWRACRPRCAPEACCAPRPPPRPFRCAERDCDAEDFLLCEGRPAVRT